MKHTILIKVTYDDTVTQDPNVLEWTGEDGTPTPVDPETMADVILQECQLNHDGDARNGVGLRGIEYVGYEVQEHADGA